MVTTTSSRCQRRGELVLETKVARREVAERGS
jgi:hypothetical protein